MASSRLVLAGVAAAAAATLAAAISSPVDYVSTLGGTQSRTDLSTGNILPEVQLPWAFNGWAPISDMDQGSWWFYSNSRKFFGIRCTRQPSPWISDYGQARFMPHITDPGHSGVGQYSGYNPTASNWQPHYFNATLLGYGGRNGYLTLEVTPTVHGAIMRFNYPKQATGVLASGWNQTRRVLLSFDSGGKDVAVGTSAEGFATITGTSTANSGSTGASFGMHYYVTVAGGGGATAVKPFSSAAIGGNNNPWAFLDFDPADANADVLVLRVATSLISAAQAQANHAAEVAGVTFDAARDSAAAIWNAELSRVSVNDVGQGYSLAETRALLTTFYSALYRAAKYPRALYEVVGGQPAHWSPYTGTVLPGVFETDIGFWDAVRSGGGCGCSSSRVCCFWKRRCGGG